MSISAERLPTTTLGGPSQVQATLAECEIYLAESARGAHADRMSWMDLVSVFLLGLAASGHCLGMCGGFGIGISAGAGRAGVLATRHVAYQLGKGTSYAFLGVLLLLVTGWLNTELPVLRLQHVMGVLAGAAMIVTGTLLALERRLPSRWLARWKASSVCQAMAALWQSKSLFRCVLIGWINGFLPCGISVVALLFLARNDSALAVVFGAFAFTAGTFPSLFAAGWLSQRVSVEARRTFVRWSGVFLVLFGVLTVLRDQPQVHGWFHSLVPGVPGAAGGVHHH